MRALTVLPGVAGSARLDELPEPAGGAGLVDTAMNLTPRQPAPPTERKEG